MSKRKAVLSHVPQESILAPILFHIFISDTGSGIECTLSKLAGDPKLSGVVDSLEGKDAIQRDLGMSKQWAHEKPHEVQQGQGQGPAPGLGQAPVSLQAGGLRAALRRRTWEYWCMKSSTRAITEHLQPRKPTVSGTASEATWLAC